ncbi:MAG: hypothetical protein PHC46_00745 [Clostridia bacterium]|nr:hypothetical protein [Clostridia bacterium]
MSIFKKSIILSPAIYDGKSEEKGILTLQKEQNKISGTLKCFNFNNLSGKMLLGITFDDGQVHKFNLEQDKINSFYFNLPESSDLTQKIACVIVNINGNQHMPVVWGSTDSNKNLKTHILQSFVNSDSASKKIIHSQIFDSVKNQKNDDYITEEVEKLIDEEVNNLEEELNSYEKKSMLNKSHLDTNLSGQMRDFKPYKEVLATKQKIYNIEAEEEAQEEIEDVEQDEADYDTFYKEVKDQIDSLFETYQRESALEEIIPNSHFVRVDFNSDGNSYIFGIIYDENSNPEYIVYGVPSLYTKIPPTELEGYYQWLPLDLEKPEEDGYWLMYQNALNGEHIKIEII